MDNTEPNDPMWATFRERHPDVNLVLLPGDGTDEQPPPAPLSSLGEAHEASAALERRVRLIGEVLGVPHDPVPGWARTPERAYQPTVRLNGSVVADTPTDAEVIEHRLSQLGWVAKARSNEAVVLVDGHSGEDFVRVTIVDGIAGVRASGAAVGLDEAAIEKLIRGNDGTNRG